MSPPLPGREPHEEDSWVAGLAGLDDEQLIEAVKEALHAGRPALAGRAVGLLGADSEDPEVHRARNAARMLLLRTEPVAWSQLDDLLQVIRRRRMKRFRDRQKASLKGELPKVGRGPRRRG